MVRDLYQSFRWVDAICVNQGEFDERNEQVGRMGEIYEEAALINSLAAVMKAAL